MEDMVIGPYAKDRIVLCSGDASPKSQKKEPCEAGYFFHRAPWVGATRNSADRLQCRFVIFTRKYGLVNPWRVIKPYDVDIYSGERKKTITDELRSTIPSLIGRNRFDLMVFYAGKNPRDLIIELMQPILEESHIDLITFGRPSMWDVGKIDKVVDLLVKGTTFYKLKSILKCPDKLELYLS